MIATVPPTQWDVNQTDKTDRSFQWLICSLSPTMQYHRFLWSTETLLSWHVCFSMSLLLLSSNAVQSPPVCFPGRDVFWCLLSSIIVHHLHWCCSLRGLQLLLLPSRCYWNTASLFQSFIRIPLLFHPCSLIDSQILNALDITTHWLATCTL